MVIPGACDTIMDDEIEKLSPVIDECDILLIQLETNISAIEKIVEIARAKGKIIVLNTAPVQPISDELLAKIDIITPNEVEASILSEVKVVDEQSAKMAAKFLSLKV